MRNIERLLNIAADSGKMPGWGDSLSYIVDNTRGEIHALSDEDLQKVAGGAQKCSDDWPSKGQPKNV